MSRLGFVGCVMACALASVSVCVLGSIAIETATARTHRQGSDNGGVPILDVKGSCADAQKFSSGDDKNTAYKGCMQDETNAKGELDRRWSSFKGNDRSNCVEQARFPSPSYVEVLTCLEMSTDAMRNAPRVDGQTVPQIGGPLAPGLPVPATPAQGAQ